jgi:hypothetical protein
MAPPLAARCAGLAGLTGDPAAVRLTELATALDEAVRHVRSAEVWDADQSLRFEAAGVLAELEALLAAVELTLSGTRDRFGLTPAGQPDQDAARYAVAWLGDLIEGRVRRLAGAGSRERAAMLARDRLLAHVAALPAGPAARPCGSAAADKG